MKTNEQLMEAIRAEKKFLYDTARRTKSKLIAEACREYAAKKGVELLKLSILLEREQVDKGLLQKRSRR